MIESFDLSTSEVIQYYVAGQEPLEYLPMLKDVFFFGSNLKVYESLEVSQDLKLIKKMPLKDIKLYLIKTANKFSHLHVHYVFNIDQEF